MVDFANAQSTWFSTWPQSDDDRAFRMYVSSFLFLPEACANLVSSDSVKMWNAC